MANMISQSDASRQPNENDASEGDKKGGTARAGSEAFALANKGVQMTRERLGDRINTQRDRVTGRVRTLSRALHGAGAMLEEDDFVAQALQYASEKVEGVAGYVHELSPDSVVEDLRGVARDRPAWFFGSAFVLGLALGRFARSTAEGVAGNRGERSDASRRANAPAPNSGREGSRNQETAAARAPAQGTTGSARSTPPSAGSPRGGQRP